MKPRKAVHWLDFHISYECPNNCIFCSEHDRMEEYRDHPLGIEEIRSELVRRKREGMTSVFFTGGEPGVYPHLREVLRFAKRAGFQVGLTTNGIPFSSRLFCRNTLPFLDEVQVSVHGHTADLHNLHTRNPRSFEAVRVGLGNIDGAVESTRLSSNIMVTRHNVEYLGEIAGFLAGFSRMQRILISNVAPEGNGMRNYPALAVKQEDLARRLQPVVAFCDAKGITVKVFGSPLCTLSDNRARSNDLFWDPRMTVERGRMEGRIGLVAVEGDRPTRDRVKTPECMGCAFESNAICGGLFKEYLRAFGDSELAAAR